MKNALRTLILAAAAILPGSATTVIPYAVTWNTAPLKAQAMAEPDVRFYFGIQLTNGGGSLASSLLILSEFDFGTGMALPDKTGFGGYSGDIGSTLYVADDEFFNGFLQEFEPGEKLNFQLEARFISDGGAFPDAFNFSLYGAYPDGDYTQFLSYDPFAGTAARADLANPLTIEAFDTFLNDSYIVPAPQFRMLDASEVPEPGGWILIASGLFVLAGWRRYR
ncbi:MAG: hypothetical protein SFV18_14480 [Bryobacteraceae bacterium]|nr:hypothetical protein [Bryobacteraceae bacterium]